MSAIDDSYFARSMARLSAIPLRVYEGNEELYHFYPAPLPRDPAALCLREIFSVTGHVGYYAAPEFLVYGIVNAGNRRFVFGPAFQIMTDDQQLREMAFRLGVPKEDTASFTAGMRAIAPLPPETLLQILCAVNHVLNGGEKLGISDVAIYDDEQILIKTAVEGQRTENTYSGETRPQKAHHALAIEEALMDIVRKGDTVALRRWISEAPAIRGGEIAGDQLRQMRNLFIVTATLASRAAIRGGMREEDAFSLSDAFIRRVELLTGYGKITNLQYNMLMEFTEQVEKLHRGKHATRLSLDVANYVRHHLSEPVSVEKMAEEFFLSRPYLSSRFRKETGQTLTDFILNEKTEEAKRLLRYSDRSLSSVSAYLGFSSQAHFSRVFRKYAGLAPGEYREKHRL